MIDSVAETIAQVWTFFADAGPLANLATLATPALAAGAGATAFFRRKVYDLHADNLALKRRLEHEQAENLKQAVTLKALRSECTALESRLADTALAQAERELRDHNDFKASQALELWLEQEGPPIAKLLMARADWAYGHAVGDLRPAAFAVTRAFASAALALDPRNRQAPPLLADLRALSAAEAQGMPSFPAALERVQDIAAAERLDPDQIVIALRATQEARRLRERGHYHLGIRVIDRAVSLFRRQIGATALQTLDARDERALLLTHAGRYHEAKTEITDVIAARTSAPRLGVDHPSTLASRFYLAQALNFLGEHAEARQVIEAVVAANAASPDIAPDSPNALASRGLFAQVVSDLGSYAEARPIIQAVVAECTASRAFGPDHPDTLFNRHRLAQVLNGLGECAEAKRVIEGVVTARAARPDIGPDHPDTLASRALLANVLDNLGDYAGARRVIESVIAAMTANPDIGPRHPSVMTSRTLLAHVLLNLNEITEARQVIETVIAAQAVNPNVGPDHPETVKSRALLAQIRGTLGADGA